VSPNVPPDFTAPWIQVAHGRKALAAASKNFFGAPDERLFLAAITGTNGKTTTSYLIDYILRAAGFKTSLVGTIGYHVAGERCLRSTRRRNRWTCFGCWINLCGKA